MELNINMRGPELFLHRNYLRGVLETHGFPAKIYLVDKVEYDHENDPTVTYKSPIDTRVILDEYPNRKVLEKLGWFSESRDNLPIIAYLPYLQEGSRSEVFKPVLHTKIEIFYDCGYSNSRIFVVTELASSFGLQSLFWVVKLAPYRDVVDLSGVHDDIHITNEFVGVAGLSEYRGHLSRCPVYRKSVKFYSGGVLLCEDIDGIGILEGVNLDLKRKSTIDYSNGNYVIYLRGGYVTSSDVTVNYDLVHDDNYDYLRVFRS